MWNREEFLRQWKYSEWCALVYSWHCPFVSVELYSTHTHKKVKLNICMLNKDHLRDLGILGGNEDGDKRMLLFF